MKYLEDYGFSKDEIALLSKTIPTLLKNQIKKYKAIVGTNLSFMRDLGISNYKEIFVEYYDMFLMDGSNFSEVFTKYDKEDLVEKLLKNMAIIEHL